ncbi:MAG: glycosyltransferase family 4 protein [Acetivibrionales bacterium]|jgi:glycosyltransferase involved in cell wall biosynthesis|nr:glycosyltransferase family 4 protein [Clostridiaceae bacterium]
MDEDKNLRVCIAMYRAYPLFNSAISETTGGSEVELFKLAGYLARFSNIKVDFIVGDYDQNDVEIVNNVRLIKVKYMNLDKYRKPIHKILRYLHLFKVLLKQRSQIYLTKTASELLGWLVFFQKFLKGKKVVFRLGSDKDTDLEFWKGNKKLYTLYKFGLKHCDKVYVQSSNQKNLLESGYGIESHLVKNVFDIFNSNSEVKKEYILWISRCEPLKRPELFIDLAKRVPEEKFLIIMPHARKGDSLLDEKIDKMINDVKKAAKELKNFKYIESVPFNEIQAYYNAAKLFVNTSEYEGFPNSFIQSCIGKTGILSYRVNPDEFLTQYGAGYLCDDDPEKAAEYIRNLNSKKIKEIGNKAYSYVVMNHDVEQIGKAYIRDFIELTDSKIVCEGVC